MPLVNGPNLLQLAAQVRALSGWRRILCAVLLGGLAAFALPPFHFIPLLIPAFAGLVWLLEGAASPPRARRRAIGAGFWFGFGHFFIGLHWIIEPMLVAPERTAWMIPFAWPGLAAVLAIFPALVCWAQSFMRCGDAAMARVLAFAALWTLGELLRSYVFTGFPWNLIGYSWSAVLPVMQITAAIGMLGLGFVTIFMAAMPSVLGNGGMSPQSRWFATLTAAVVLPALLWAGGAVRLAGGEAGFVPDVHLRLVQANIAQRDKWNRDLRSAHLARHIAMSREAARDGAPAPTLVIWPETAVPFLLANDTLMRIQASKAVPMGGALVTGSVRSAFGARERQLFNSLLAIDGRANIRQVYDKGHLVPFGEYIPFRGILPMEKIAPGQGDFTPGENFSLFRIDGVPPASPLICYEAIFPGRVTPEGKRPSWLLNITNDAWFGDFAGPRQHYAIASARAVEEGLPLVRAANTGISAVVDPYGRVLSQLDSGVAGILDSGLPRGLSPTLYAHFGDLIPVGFSLLLLVLTVVWGRRRGTS